ncbi:MAG: class I SAM-dependent DNA methyltransferase [Mycobacterium sp.]
MSTRWQLTGVADDYDARWRALQEAGQNIHGEADLVEALLGGAGHSVLDAGCGTGRVAIELSRRGFTVAGVDADRAMLAAAKDKAPQLRWAHADLAAAHWPPVLPGRVDLALLAGNVMIFLAPDTERRVLANLAARLAPGGLLVAGFSLRPGQLTLEDYDAMAAAAGLMPAGRWATWDRQPYRGGDYAVSAHRRPE